MTIRLFCSTYSSTAHEMPVASELNTGAENPLVVGAPFDNKHKVSPKKKKPQQQTKEERKAYEEKRLRTPDKRFGGLTEEEIKLLLLPDRLADNLDILFVSF